MKTKLNRLSGNRSIKGQSLVEVALILPIMVIIIAGVVEVSNLLITKNRVETAARAAARYAAAGGQSIETVVLNTVTQTLDLSEGVWDIFLLKGTVNSGGDDFAEWEWPHLYGISNTTAFTRVVARLDDACLTNCIRDEVLYQLQTNEQGVHIEPVSGQPGTQIAADLQVVGVVIIHDINSILGLDTIPALSNVTSVSGLGIMRLSGIADSDETSGCGTAFPLLFSYGVRSLSQGQYPAASAFTFPTPPPTFQSFTRNPPDIEFPSAQEGNIFLFNPPATSPPTMGWLRWNDGVPEDATSLANSLAWPGNVSHSTAGFIDARDNQDNKLHVEDAVAATNIPGALGQAAVQTVLNQHINLKRVLRVLVVSEVAANPITTFPGVAPHFTPNRFATVRLHGYSVSNNWLLVEFVNWDNSCGQP